MSIPLLYEVFPALEGKIPWMSLGNYPTPVKRLQNLGRRLNHDELWLKRDDITSDIYGGNKVRKLEFWLARAKAEGKKRVLTLGAIGSNHALATILHGSKQGLQTGGVFFPQLPTEHVLNNLLADFSAGAKLFYAANFPMIPLAVLRARMTCRLEDGMAPLWIPAGGSSAVATLGYVNAAFELKKQIEAGEMPEPDFAYVPIGTCGTFAGLHLGFQLAGMKTKAVGILVVPEIITNARVAAKLARGAAEVMTDCGVKLPQLDLDPKNMIMLKDYLGEGYGFPTDEGTEACDFISEDESIHLEGTYTGKALAAAIESIRKGEAKGKTILFWNTLNSADVTRHHLPDIDYRRLPQKFHKFFS
jgi:1-aminocyclopropane-1-carboxylate deaminase/D-cysteine desulfhydrase-like pyridoxal-dependent ACC family enzyme